MRALLIAAALFAAAGAMLAALRCIASQSVGDDWTAAQAIAFAKMHARDAITQATAS